MKICKLFIAIFLFFISVSQCFSQSVKCIDGNVKIPLFKQDSVISFNNSFVKRGLLGNIKNSKYPFEIRVYTIGSDSRHVWITSLMTSKKESVLTHREIYLDDLKFIHADQLEEKNANNYSSGKIKKSNIEVTHKMIDSLIGYNLFSMQSYKMSEYVDSDRPNVIDGVSISTFEIKVGNVFRNFEYLDDLARKDTVVNRSDDIFNILNILKHLNKTNFR